MQFIVETANLRIFESGEFVVGGRWSGPKILFVGFEADDENTLPPAVTAVVTVRGGSETADPVLEWLETSSQYRHDMGQTFRDEFMRVLELRLPRLFMSHEKWEGACGTVYYLDTQEGRDIEADEETEASLRDC